MSAGHRQQKYFHRGRLDWNHCSKAGHRLKARCKPLQVSPDSPTGQEEPSKTRPPPPFFVSMQEYLLSQGTEHRRFLNLLERMLEYDPAKRMALSPALHHPFFLPLRQAGASQVWRNSCNMSR